ncbi:MAG: response regulator [Thermoguttaceae bacterium]
MQINLEYITHHVYAVSLMLGAVLVMIGLTVWLRRNRASWRFVTISWLILLVVLALNAEWMVREDIEQQSDWEDHIRSLTTALAASTQELGHARLRPGELYDQKLLNQITRLQAAWCRDLPFVAKAYTFRLRPGKNDALDYVCNAPSDVDFDCVFEGVIEEGGPPFVPFVIEGQDVWDEKYAEAFEGKHVVSDAAGADNPYNCLVTLAPLYDDSGNIEAVLRVDYHKNNVGPDAGHSHDKSRGQLLFSILFTLSGIVMVGNLRGSLAKSRAYSIQMQAMQEAKRETDERMRVMFDSTPMASTLWDADTMTMIACNAGTLRLFGVNSAEEYIANFYRWSPEFQPCGRPSQEMAVEQVQAAIADGSVHFEWIHQRFDGTAFPADVTLACTMLNGRSVVAGFVRDMTEEKESQRQAVEANERLQVMFDANPIAYTLWDAADMKLINCNAVALKLYGLVSEQDFIENFDKLSPEYQPSGRPSMEVAFENVTNVKTTGFHCFEWMHQRADNGVPIPAEVTLVRSYLNGRMVIAGFVRDLTEHKQSQENLAKEQAELRRAKDAAEKSARVKSEFLANMSHEIRTPMNAILGMTYLCLQTEMTEQQRDYLDKAQSATTNLLRIIDDILDFSKIEAGKLGIEEVPFRLSETMRDIGDVLAFKVQEKKLVLRTEIDPSVPDELLGDPLRLRQILLNLANNAIKFTSEGEVAILVSCEVSDATPVVQIEKSGVVLAFSVSDTGIGMTPEQVQRLFTSFTQADSSTTRKYGGTGLGLVISKNLVELMGGQIDVTSTAGVGTTFRFTVRMRENFAVAAAYSGESDLSHCRFLIVDDNETDREYISKLAHNFTSHVDTVESGEKAIEALQRASREGMKYDLLLIDWKMPRLDGIETIRRIRDDEQIIDPPGILMASAYDRSECLRQTAGLGLAGMLTKPISMQAFEESVREVIRYNHPVVHHTQASEPRDIAGARILLAEDNKINQIVAQGMLAMLGVELTIANDGAEAVALVRDRDFDLILMDVQMPNMDGLEATQAIRHLDKPGIDKLPILAMTANAMDVDYQKSLAVGMNDHLTKPIDPIKLRKALETWLPEKQSEHEA